jgi:hypothetical protein
MVEAITSIPALRDNLLASHPSSFGGLYKTGDNAYVVQVVGNSPNIQAAITDWRAQGAHASLALSIQQATTPLADLIKLSQSVLADADAWKAEGVPVVGAGVDDSKNVAVIDIGSPPTPDLIGRFSQKYGSDRFDFRQAPATPQFGTSRYADSPPWNAGDRVISNYPVLNGCTSGWGVHDGSGYHSLLIAAHCGDPYFTGTTDSFTWFNNSNVYATTPAGVNWMSNHFDSMLMNPGYFGSSNIFWQGLANKHLPVAFAYPVIGDTDCAEGSYGLESCGNVSQVNSTINGVLIYVVSGAQMVHGDSGGPAYSPSIYGDIAHGTLDQLLSVPGVYQYGATPVGLQLYLSGTQLNTVANP